MLGKDAKSSTQRTHVAVISDLFTASAAVSRLYWYHVVYVQIFVYICAHAYTLYTAAAL